MNIAIIIDGDNINSIYTEDIISKSKEFGKIVLRRVYGDFSSEHLKSWKQNCIKYTLDSQQVWLENYKNSTDIAIITDIFSNIITNYDIQLFIIVSGDGDFSLMISSLKKLGKTVYGFSSNRKSTSSKLINICDRFIYLDKNNDNDIRMKEQEENKIFFTNDNFCQYTEEDLIIFIRNIILDNDNYIQLNHLRDNIIRKWSDFDWNIYGSFKEFLETSIKGLKIIYDNKKQWATLSN